MRSRLQSLPVGSAHPTSHLERPAPEAGWSAEQSASGATTFSSPKERPPELWIPSAGRPGRTLHYRCCDYAPLWSRPRCPAPCDRGWKIFRWAVPTLHLTQSSRHRRQGGLQNKVHPEPLPSLRRRSGLPNFGSPPLEGRASPYTINAATMHLCGADHPAPHAIAAAKSSQYC